MSGIARVQIKNFQCHGLLDIHLDAGVNSIVGPSDTGKSAIIRAIVLALTNEPKGEAYRKDGTKKTVVKATMFDKATIKRVRTNTINKFVFNGEDLKAVGSGIPEEVENYLHMNAVNHQAQHDKVFWFSETAGEVSRQLNRIVNLEVIDGTLYRLNSKLRDNNGLVKAHKKNLEQYNEEVEGFAFVDKYVDQAQAMHAWYDILRDTDKQVTRLDCLVTEVEEEQTYIKENEEALTHGHRALLYLDDLIQLEKEKARLVELGKAATQHRRTLKNAPPDFTPVEEAYDAWTDIKKKAEHLDCLIKTAEIREKEIWLHQKSKNESNAKLKKQFAKGCPLCGKLTTTK